jgi:AraC-like DNA-binding protein
VKPAIPPSWGFHFQKSRFDDQDELCSLLKGGSAEFIQKGRGAFEGNFTFVGLNSGTLQYGYIKLPHVGKGASMINRVGFLIRLDLRGEWICRGQSMDPRTIIYFPPRAEYQDVVPGNSSWAFVSFERETLERELLDRPGESSPLGSQGTHLFLPTQEAFEILRRRLKAVYAAVSTDPTLLDVPEARRGVEESVLSVLANALGSASRIRPASDSAALRSRLARQLDAYLSANTRDTVYLSDLCSVTGVSERTLRTVFQEHFGMSPVQYLKVRRMHHVRRALRRADSDRNTVQGVANRYGIWHLGRFAAEYRSLFGESPAETLKKSDETESSEAETLPARQIR